MPLLFSPSPWYIEVLDEMLTEFDERGVVTSKMVSSGDGKKMVVWMARKPALRKRLTNVKYAFEADSDSSQVEVSDLAEAPREEDNDQSNARGSSEPEEKEDEARVLSRVFGSGPPQKRKKTRNSMHDTSSL